MRPRALVFLLVAAALALAGAMALSATSPDAWARRLLRSAGVQGGLIVHVGCGDGRRTVALRINDRYIVQGLERDPALVASARRYIASRGLYGKVSVRRWSADKLPYCDNLVNLLVVEPDVHVARAELLRVLCPDGVAYVLGPQRQRLVKPRPKEIDDWPQHCHGADGNPVAQDLVVGPPKHLQWTAGPRWLRSHDTDSSISAVVISGGRLIYIVDEAPTSMPGNHPLPDKWALACRDAFNGVLQWKIPIRQWGWRQWKKTWFSDRPDNLPVNLPRRLVAAGDRVYVTLGYHAPVSEIDAATGRILRTYKGTEDTREILYCNGVLLLTLFRNGRLRLSAVQASSGERLWQTGDLSGTNREYFPYWRSKENTDVPVDPVLNPASDGKIVALIDGRDIVGLNFATGEELWRTRVEEKEKSAWVGLLIVADGVVLHGGAQRLTALQANDGKLLWTRDKKPIGWLWFQWKDVFVVDGLVWTWSPDLEQAQVQFFARKYRARWPASVNAYDLHTGKLRRKVALGPVFKTGHHHRCYRNRATPHYLIASRRGAEFIDLRGGIHYVNNWVRGTCHLGNFPANGLFYATPHPCVCYSAEKLSGFNALAPAREGEASDTAEPPTPQPERGPAYGKVQASGAEDPADAWPTYRHDFMRSACTPAPLAARLSARWTARPAGRLSPPVIAGGLALVACIDEHRIVALRLADGSRAWEFFADARIDSPPTVWGEAVLFGSADGCVYCLRLSDGALVWRLRAAPEDRFVGAWGQLESAWPVHGSIAVRDGVAYFSAGRSSHLDGGIRLFAVDVATGRVLHGVRLHGPELRSDNIKDNGTPPQGVLSDILQADGKGVYLRNLAFTPDLKPGQDNPNRIRTVSGFLDDTYFKRAPWRYASNKNWGRLLTYSGSTVYLVRMFDTLRCLDPKNFFTPGQKGYALLAQPVREGSTLTVPNSPSLDPKNKPLTVEAWVRAESESGAVVVRGGEAWGYGLVIEHGRPQFVLRMDSKVYSARSSQRMTGRWTHLAGVLREKAKGAEMKLFVNGRPAAAAEAPGLMAATPGQSTNVGCDLGTGVGDYKSPFPLTGDIDEVRIYYRALSDDEVARHYADPAAVPATDKALVLYLPFDDGTARDASGKGNNGEFSAAAAVQGKRGKALHFGASEGARWSVRVPIRVRAMALSAPPGVPEKHVLAIAGPPDVIDANDPLAAFEGRKGGHLWMVSARDGHCISKLDLPSPPTFNGIAIARGMLLLCTVDGRVMCFGGP